MLASNMCYMLLSRPVSRIFKGGSNKYTVKHVNNPIIGEIPHHYHHLSHTRVVPSNIILAASYRVHATSVPGKAAAAEERKS